jgi:hypothetical protein
VSEPRISVQDLRKKYSRPRRASDVSWQDGPEEYCVGGALCMEVEPAKAMHFPDDEHLIQAVKAANPDAYTAWMKDEEYSRWRSKIAEVQTRNDIGDFKGAWAALEELLNWPETPIPEDFAS